MALGLGLEQSATGFFPGSLLLVEGEESISGREDSVSQGPLVSPAPGAWTMTGAQRLDGAKASGWFEAASCG